MHFWKTKTYFTLAALIMSLAFFIFPATVHAATYYFNNAAADGNWSNASNWWTDASFTVPGAVPGTSDDAVISANVTQTGLPPSYIHSLVVTSTATFYIGVYVSDGATLYGSSTNFGRINGTTTFYASSTNLGQVFGNAFFYDSSVNVGLLGSAVTGNATFYNNSYNNANIGGTTTFNDNSYNNTSVTLFGNAVFNDASYNLGTILGTVDVYYPSPRPVGGTVGTTTYHNYPFVTTWKTDNPGTSSSTAITIPTTGGGYNYSVDWGDSSSSTGLTGDATHNYATAGTYTVTISGTFPRIYFHGGGDAQKILSVQQWGTNAWSSMNEAFHGASNLVITATDTPNLSNVTDMSAMFFGASSMDQNINSWDVSHVTNLSYLFYGASSFNQPLSNWNVASTTYMNDMFANDVAFNQPLNSWNVSNVLTTAGMFLDTPAFNQPLNNWNTGSLVDMTAMFAGATTFNQDISSWNVSRVGSMSGLFSGATAFNQPLNSWNVASTTDMMDMFHGATSFNQPLSSWNVAKVTTFFDMFYNATNFNQPLSSWNPSSAEFMLAMFASDTAFDQDISSWDIHNVVYMDDMFSGDTLSTAHYDALLNGWAAESVHANVTFDAGNSQYCSASAARASLISSHSWTITDGGPCAVTPTPTPVAHGAPAVFLVTPASLNGTPLTVVVNSAATGTITTATATVQLAFNGSSSIKGYTLSLDPNFTAASIVPYASTAAFTLPGPGTYTLYTKFFSTTGNASPVITRTIEYTKATAPARQVAQSTNDRNVFTRVLKLGSTGADVKALQQFLNTHGFAVAKTGAGSLGYETTTFGPATMKAVVAFQNAHASDILKPNGLTKGTGIVGPSTDKVLNAPQ